MRKQRLIEGLREQTAQARTLDEVIAKKMEEFSYGEGWCQQLFGHYTPRATIQRELQEAGYALEEELAFLPKQVFLIFVKNPQ